jgi:succinyl-diaminopimelate desuccinylase
MSATLQLTKTLIERRSVTPDDAGCQALLGERLKRAGFELQTMRFGAVDNLWARRGDSGPLLVLAGHTDVVPPGPTDAWKTDPFQPTEKDGCLYGRGAADMKAGLAAMITAAERFLEHRPNPPGSLAFLITSDEEGDAVDGTRRVIEQLTERGETIDWCLVGEPSSSETLGDTIKHGRRGSLSGRLRVIGRQGHVAYPQLADNPVHRASAALAALCERSWDPGNAHFPPTSFQISNINAGTGAGNVIPGTLEVAFNFRYSTETDEARLREQVEALLDRHGLDYQLEWSLSGRPFLTETGALLDAARAGVEKVTGRTPVLSTAGGTSDGRFIAPAGAQVVELGPVNRTIHQANECVRIEDLESLSAIYQAILEELIG